MQDNLENIPRVTTKYEGRLETLLNRLDSTRIERLVTVDVDLSYRKSISKTTLLMTSRVDTCDSSRFVYIEYPNLMLKYVLSSSANRLPVRRIYFTNDESCPPVRIVPFHAFRTWKVHVVIFSFHATHFHTLLTTLHFR